MQRLHKTRNTSRQKRSAMQMFLYDTHHCCSSIRQSRPIKMVDLIGPSRLSHHTQSFSALVTHQIPDNSDTLSNSLRSRGSLSLGIPQCLSGDEHPTLGGLKLRRDGHLVRYHQSGEDGPSPHAVENLDITSNLMPAILSTFRCLQIH